MPNGDGINAGPFFDDWFDGDCRYGYPGRQNVAILPDPANSEGYYFFHLPKQIYSQVGEILYSYIDMKLDNGKGDIIEKNVKVYDETRLLSNYLSSISHSNQKDWWIVNPAFSKVF